MQRVIFSAFVVPSLFVVGFAVTGCAASRAGDSHFKADDEAAIRKRIATLETSWNAHDLNAIGPVYRENAEFINVVGMNWRGRDAIVKAHVAFHENMFKSTSLHTDEISIRPLNTDYAIAVWLMTVGASITPNGNMVPVHQARMTMVFAKDEQSGWQVVQAQNTNVDAIAAQFDPVNKK